MKNFDKKLLIILFFFFIIICITIYFFTNNSNNDVFVQDDFYFEENLSENDEELSGEIIIHIDGEVVNPGIVHLATNSRIADAIYAAGGTTNFADVSKINLAYMLTDGQKVYIPSIYDTNDIVYIQSDAGENIIDSNTVSTSNLININFATQSELETLPGIGTSTASKIIDYRKKNGNFKKVEDIMNVSGIGEAKFSNIKDYICI